MPTDGAAESRAEAPLVAAVVLTWNDIDMTRDCLRTVLANGYHPLEIVVVDNGSSFPTLEPLAEEFPAIHPVQLDRNHGFTGGCNRGLDAGLDLGAKYLLLLNNDTLLDARAIPKLVEAMERDETVGAASALLLNPDAERTVFCQLGWIDRDRAYIRRTPEAETLADRHRPTLETEFAPACAVLFRAEMLRQVGTFDEALFTNWEDYDLMVRIADAGWKIVVVGESEVVHIGNQTTGGTSPFIVYFSTRNRLVCLFKYGRLAGILRNAPFIARSFYWQVRRYGLSNLACHRAFAKACLHFVLGVRGEGNAPKSRDDKATGKKKY